jgi:hypothetical protein
MDDDAIDPRHCIHFGASTGQRCPRCQHVVGEPIPKPQPAPQVA